ncbi:MAG: lipase family protein [Planctomycetes bacterium]|nr:lipase family protein [Planctomycetota bacterium]
MEPFENFDSMADAFSRCNAYSLGEAARLAYTREPNSVSATLADWGFEPPTLLDHRDTQGFVARNDSIILIAFRGTEPRELADWLTDIDARLVAGPGGKVHQGFLGALFDVWWELRAAIDAQQDPAHPRTLWFTGHSLGAALATLATAKLRIEEDKPVAGLYTFGSPRVGDSEFSGRFDVDFRARTFRFVNNRDVVTRIPPRLLGYRHVGVECYFDGDGVFSQSPARWMRFLEEVTITVEAYKELPKNAFDDHSMDRYVALLKSLCP